MEEPPPAPVAATDLPADTAPQVVAPSVPAQRPKQPVADPPAQRASAREEIREHISRLRGSAESGNDALKELWEVEARLIPDLILELESAATTQIRELKILIPDKEQFTKRYVGLDAKGQGFVYEIPGMGTVVYDDLATGPAKGKGLKLILKRFSTSAPFTVGEALRSALLNRFRSGNYPAGDHRSNLIGWWQKYYEQVRAGL